MSLFGDFVAPTFEIRMPGEEWRRLGGPELMIDREGRPRLSWEPAPPGAEVRMVVVSSGAPAGCEVSIAAPCEHQVKAIRLFSTKFGTLCWCSDCGAVRLAAEDSIISAEHDSNPLPRGRWINAMWMEPE